MDNDLIFYEEIEKYLININKFNETNYFTYFLLAILYDELLEINNANYYYNKSIIISNKEIYNQSYIYLFLIERNINTEYNINKIDDYFNKLLIINDIREKNINDFMNNHFRQCENIIECFIFIKYIKYQTKNIKFEIEEKERIEIKNEYDKELFPKNYPKKYGGIFYNILKKIHDNNTFIFCDINNIYHGILSVNEYNIFTLILGGIYIQINKINNAIRIIDNLKDINLNYYGLLSLQLSLYLYNYSLTNKEEQKKYYYLGKNKIIECMNHFNISKKIIKYYIKQFIDNNYEQYEYLIILPNKNKLIKEILNEIILLFLSNINYSNYINCDMCYELKQCTILKCCNESKYCINCIKTILYTNKECLNNHKINKNIFFYK